MSQIFVLKPDGRHEAVPEDEIRAQLAAGLLSPDTLCWREGMSKWKPLSEGLDQPASPLPAALLPAPGPPPLFQLRCWLEPWSTLVEILLGFCVFAGLANLYAAIGTMSLISRVHLDLHEARIHDGMVHLFAIISVVCWIITMISLLFWFYGVSENCHGWSTGLHYSSGLAVVSFFVPLANLIFPYLFLQEIWKSSGSPRNWKSRQSSLLIWAWWMLWLVTGLMGVYFFFSAKPHSRADLSDITLLKIIFEVLRTAFYAVTFAVVYRITNRQKRLV